MQNTPLILTPGPVRVPDFVLQAISRPVIHQRGAAFQEFFAQLQSGLQYFFQTESPVLSLAGSGTFGVRAAMGSLFSQEEEVLIVDFGKFSHRWKLYGDALSLKVLDLTTEWGQVPKVEAIISMLETHPDCQAMVLTHCETSTGGVLDLEEIAFAARALRPEILIVVDAISSAGALPLYTDAWELDTVIACSQKTLMNPAGTAFVSLSQRAQHRLSPAQPQDYLHLGTYLKSLNQGSYPFTPPTQMLFGIEAALQQIKSEGLPAVWNRTHSLSRRFKREILTLGGELFGEAQGDALTAFSFPEKDQDALRTRLLEQMGVEISGGQEHLKGKIMRCGHFGAIGPTDLDRCLEGLKAVLALP